MRAKKIPGSGHPNLGSRRRWLDPAEPSCVPRCYLRKQKRTPYNVEVSDAWNVSFVYCSSLNVFRFLCSKTEGLGRFAAGVLVGYAGVFASAQNRFGTFAGC